MSYVSYVITETVNGKEVQVWQTYSIQHACAILCDYTEQDKEDLKPRIYKKLPNGYLTNELD